MAKHTPRTRKRKATARRSMHNPGMLETLVRRLYVRRFPNTSDDTDESPSDLERLIGGSRPESA